MSLSFHEAVDERLKPQRLLKYRNHLLLYSRTLQPFAFLPRLSSRSCQTPLASGNTQRSPRIVAPHVHAKHEDYSGNKTGFTETLSGPRYNDQTNYAFGLISTGKCEHAAVRICMLLSVCRTINSLQFCSGRLVKPSSACCCVRSMLYSNRHCSSSFFPPQASKV